MQKESVIEREIRLAREREEAYRKEKGLVNGTAQPRQAAASTTPSSAPVSSSSSSSLPAAPRPQATSQADGRDVQHRMATSRIQLEIQETGQKERELRDAGKILTTSEETVDAKVTSITIIVIVVIVVIITASTTTNIIFTISTTTSTITTLHIYISRYIH